MLTYLVPDRPPIQDLYTAYHCLEMTTGACRFTLCSQEVSFPGVGPTDLPILSLRSPLCGPALWVVAGIHGEEPAGPVAVARCAEVFAHLRHRDIPFVLLPLCNPRGYLLDWRYPDLRREATGLAAGGGHSVGDCEHLLMLAQDSGQPRARGRTPACPEAGALADHLLDLVSTHPPLLSLDLHEDERSAFPTAYLYSQGRLGLRDPVAREVAAILEQKGFALPHDGTTRFGEAIVGGIVPPTHDGSLDELLSCAAYVRDGQVRPGPHAGSVLVVETPTVGVPLETRVAAHEAILCALPRLWEMAQEVA